ncbi:hypothetical protein [Thalassotalea profundi]|uniref:Solute-binding protein family 3/N-terminal domain-containing protein n=1 Tax=Thalassotalea profundi TaxID=2036687 RepID=A0ABQ3IMJ3_9GAMM|nr:hypothetical protein [Thalassotalea profundi]GHE86520.1 hypothetical protein GCM10011501_14640 [Thalassotalea profundi]
MPYRQFSLLTILLFITFIAHGSVEKITIHTNNKAEFNAFKNNNATGNLSVSTNLYALKHVYSSIEFKYMTTQRTLHQIDEGQSICTVNRVKNKERLKKFLFSQPINLFLSQRLYQQIDSAPLKSSNNIINLSNIFNEKPNARILLAEQMSYGDAIDSEIKRIPEKNKMRRYSGEQEIGIANMFVKKRAEFAILYPQQVYNYITNVNARSYEIKGTPPYILGHLMCTNTPENNNFINKVNRQLNSNIEELLNLHLDFVNPSDKAMLTHYFHQAFQRKSIESQ